MWSIRRACSVPCVFFGLAALALPLAIEIDQPPAGSLVEALSPSMAVEIGEASSTELPITEPAQRPPVSGTPQLQRLRRGASDQ